MVRIRIMLSASDSGTSWDLRCLVRESVMTHVQQQHSTSLPRQRWEMIDAAG